MAALALTVVVYLPVLSFGFLNGDDAVWWMRGLLAVAEPGRLLAPIGQFYRPINTCTMALEVLLFGTHLAWFHTVNLVLHLVCGSLLWVALRRFAVPTGIASLATALWLCSPFTLEPVLELANAPDLYLPIAWLTMVVLWPERGATFTPTGRAVVVTLALVSLLTKEVAVVLPGLVLANELWISRHRLGEAIRRVLPAAVVTAVYLAAYFLLLPVDKGGYYGGGLAAAAKVPHALAAFLNLEVLQPQDFPFGPSELLATAVVAALAWLGWRRGNCLGPIGIGFVVLAFLPYLPVAFMTSRYTFIPYLGFLMVVAGAVEALVRDLAGRRRTVALAASGLVGLFFLGTNLVWLRGDLVDSDAVAGAITRLVDEARVVAPGLPGDRPVVALRLERVDPLVELNARQSNGLPKVFYQRPSVPYGLVEWAPLLSFARHPEGPVFEKVEATAAAPTPYAVLAHEAGRFVILPAAAATVAAEVDLWRRRGVLVTVLQARPPGI